MATRTLIQGLLKSVGLVLIPLLVLGGCASSGPARIPSSGSIVAASNVNPNPEGRASPIVVRIYELHSAKVFQTADFFSLYGHGAKTLGKDLLGEQEYELQPGESQKFAHKLPHGTRFVGVVAAFRNIDKANWRALAALPHKKKGLLAKADFLSSSKVAVHVRLEHLSVSVSVNKR